MTEYLSQRFVFRCFRIVDQEERDHFERRIIATLAACPVCKPSPTWLGRLCYSTKVHRSGLWNSNYVDGPTATAEDLNRLDELIDETLSNERPLAATLLLIPCSKGKRAARHLSLSTRCVVDLLGERARAVLEEGRRLAFARTALDERSTQRPAIAMYSGHPYATPGFIDELVAAIRAGLHCLVISGGYGVVRAEEPIHAYEAHLPTQTRSVWASRIPVILADYVQRNGIQRTFGCFSSGYASVIPDMLSREDWRSVAAFDPITDEGAAMRAVPKKVGRRLTTLLRSGMRTSAEWSQP